MRRSIRWSQLTLVPFSRVLARTGGRVLGLHLPVLLAAGLGLAFRNRPADVLKIAAATPELAQALGQEKLLSVRQLPLGQAEEALRTGKVSPGGRRGGGRSGGLPI